MQLSLAYDVDQEVVLIQSPVSGELHAFDLEHLDDFLAWLKGGRHSRERWHGFEMVYRFAGELLVVVLNTGGGHHQDFLVFSEGAYLEQVKGLETAINDLKTNLIRPARHMKGKGMTEKEVIEALNRRNLFALPAVWKASPPG